jgi:hypothetical protein
MVGKEKNKTRGRRKGKGQERKETKRGRPAWKLPSRVLH